MGKSQIAINRPDGGQRKPSSIRVAQRVDVTANLVGKDKAIFAHVKLQAVEESADSSWQPWL